MSLKDTKIVIKEDGGSSSTLKKKKKKEEEKAVAVIKDDNASRLREVARDSVTKGVAKRDSAQTGNRTPSYAESREPTPTVLSNSTSPKMATTERREFTYDDYINAVASEKAKGMLNRYFKTGEVPSNLPSTLKQRISGSTASRLREGDHEVVEGVANRAASNAGNTSPISTKPDYSSPTAAWRNPETFQAIPWSDYEGLNKYDRKAYLKAYAENSQREKAQRDAVAQAEAQRIKQEESDKMLADHFYGRMLKGEQIDVSNFDTKTLQNLQQRAYEDYSNGNLSMEKYLLMPIHNFESLDNRQAKVYNGDIDNPTQPLMQTSGFDRYRTERYDYVPANHVGNKKSSSENNGNLIKYDREAAAAYGIQYGYSYNDEYMNMNDDWFSFYHKVFFGAATGSDCANFVSQCLAAGGIKSNDEWHSYYQLNKMVDPVFQSDNPAFTLYYDANNQLSFMPDDFEFTPEWVLVKPQFEYFSNPKNGYTSKPPVVITSPDDLADAISKYNIQKGDLLYWSRDGGDTLYHSTIISDIEGNEIKYAGHSGFADKKDLYKRMSENGETVVIILMNDYIRN